MKLSSQNIKFLTAVKRACHSKQGRDLLLYLMSVAVAFVFWLFLSLDSETQRDFDIPVEIQNLPDTVTLISPLPPTLTVSVKGKDSQLLKFKWGGISSLKFKWEDNSEDHNFTIPHTKLDNRLREYFGNGIQIVSFLPDSIKTAYSTRPAKKIKVNLNADVKTNLQYIISGQLTLDVDSVSVYSVGELTEKFDMVQTERLTRTDLRDTTKIEVKLRPQEGLRFIPDHVVVTVPVEPLISKRRQIPVEVVNVPFGLQVITFPSKVEMSYLVPMSQYSDDIPMKAFVDYNDLDHAGNKVGVSLNVIPKAYHSVSLEPDSVEYVIELSQK